MPKVKGRFYAAQFVSLERKNLDKHLKWPETVQILFILHVKNQTFDLIYVHVRAKNLARLCH